MIKLSHKIEKEFWNYCLPDGIQDSFDFIKDSIKLGHLRFDKKSKELKNIYVGLRMRSCESHHYQCGIKLEWLNNKLYFC